MSEKEEKNEKQTCLYFDITNQEKDSAIRYLLGAIINSRRDGKFPSNYYTFDEDVNIYLAHLLFAISLPEYHDMAEPYLSLDTSDVLKWVKETDDRTIRYFIFKVNADYLLIHSAIFDDLNKSRNHSLFKNSPKHYRELAKLYYDQAAAYHRRIYRKRTGVGDVLEKLSHYFDLYQSILKLARREYFNFLNGYRDQVFKHFMKDFNQYEVESKKRLKMDQFLDLYAQWMKSQNPIIASEIQKVIDEIMALDPGFEFDLEKHQQKMKGSDDERQCA